MEIGKKIADFRMQKELTQQKLANIVGVSQPMIAQIERGTRPVTIQLAKEIARVLEVDILEIIGRD